MQIRSEEIVIIITNKNDCFYSLLSLFWSLILIYYHWSCLIFFDQFLNKQTAKKISRVQMWKILNDRNKICKFLTHKTVNRKYNIYYFFCCRSLQIRQFLCLDLSTLISSEKKKKEKTDMKKRAEGKEKNRKSVVKFALTSSFFASCGNYFSGNEITIIISVPLLLRYCCCCNKLMQ